MYSFSNICRICLRKIHKNFIQINTPDLDRINISDKLIYCIPEIGCNHERLPEIICQNCFTNLKRFYKFKSMCIKNSKLLENHVTKLSQSVGKKSDLSVHLQRPIMAENIKTEAIEDDANKDGVSMFSISLNQWDLFETKFTCRCIKEFNSFTENTTHLCKNCEGELLGFQLSKIKVSLAENRYNRNRQSLLSNVELSNLDNSLLGNDDSMETSDFEKGFDYNDILLCKVHVNAMRKQIMHLTNECQAAEKVNQPIEAVTIKNEPIEPDDLETISSQNFNNIDPLSVQKSTIARNTITKTLSVKKFICPLCKKAYAKQNSLKVHFASHPKGKFLHCQICARKYVRPEDLDHHMKTIHRKAMIIESTPIQTLFSPKKNRKMSAKDLSCSYCGKTFHRRYHVLRHEQIHTRDKNYPNASVDDQFSLTLSPISLDNISTNSTPPIKSELNTSDDSLVCGTCDKVFAQKSHLAVHLMTHFGRKEFKCTMCSKEFFRKENLQEHISTHTKKPNGGGAGSHDTSDVTCLKCNKTYCSASNLKRHVQKHHIKNESGEPPAAKKRLIIRAPSPIFNESGRKYPCPQCEKGYNHKSNLRRHMVKHLDENYVCSVCSGQFSRLDMLERHIFEVHAAKTESNSSIHSDNDTEDNYEMDHSDNVSDISKITDLSHDSVKTDPDTVYPCPVCDSYFNHLSNLKKHVKIHADNPVKESEYRKSISTVSDDCYCKICKKYFSKKGNLTSHMKKIHNNSPGYVCKYCQMVFNNQHEMMSHRRVHFKKSKQRGD